MKVLHQDRRTGEIKLFLENLDDLWHLKNIVNANDLVWASTYRRSEEKADKIRSEKPDKKPMRLGIRVERVEFQEFNDKIRILGRIEQGPQDIGHHHALMLGPGDDVSVFKENWMMGDLERIKGAVEQAAKPSIFFIAIDDSEAAVFLITQVSVRELGGIQRTGTGKMFESKATKESYFEEVIGMLSAIAKNEPIVIIGPGFAKEALMTYMKEKHPDLAARATSIASGQTGAAGVYEVMKKGLGGKVLETSRIVIEAKLIDEVLTRISKDLPVAYGPDFVRKSVESGAVEILLVTEKEAKSEHGERLMRLAEQNSGKVEIISTTHDAGKQLESLGGIAALLRYKIDLQGS